MKRQELHSLPLRIWHWINTLVIFLLIITGLQLRVPDLQLFAGYRNAVLIHKLVGFVMVASFLFWLIYSSVSGSLRKYYAFRGKDLKGLTVQGRYYLFDIFLRRRNPFHATPAEKFNALQKIAYISVQFLFTPVILVTGIFFSDIVLFRPATDVIGGIRVLDAIHVTAAYVFVLYLIVHVYMSTMGKSAFTHIKAMFTGYEDEEA
jgi:thiosulfate reductase cytochrome b subunit